MPERLAHYLLQEKIGTGGMGTVYRALDEDSGEAVAVKILHPHLAADSEYVRRFEREARIARSIDSPDVVKTLDSGHEGETYFLVMAYVAGDTLAEYINQRGQLPVDDAVTITAAIARALVAANAKSIIHRDISPQNVIITPQGEARVTDFGISRDLNQTVVTATNLLMGKPLYIAPEIFTSGSKADIRADIYALGIVIFQMLVGEVPFNAETPYAVMQKHVNQPTPEMGAMRSDVPPWVVTLVERCLAKDPEARYQTPDEIVAAIDEAVREKQTIFVPIGGGSKSVNDTPIRVAFAIDLRRESGGGGGVGEYYVVLRNEGDRNVLLRLDASDADNSLEFALASQRMLAPGNEDLVPLTVRSRVKRWAGGKRTVPFTVSAIAADGNGEPPRNATGVFEDAPQRLPILIAGGGVALAAVGIIAGLVIGGGGGAKSGEAKARPTVVTAGFSSKPNATAIVEVPATATAQAPAIAATEPPPVILVNDAAGAEPPPPPPPAPAAPVPSSTARPVQAAAAQAPPPAPPPPVPATPVPAPTWTPVPAAPAATPTGLRMSMLAFSTSGYSGGNLPTDRVAPGGTIHACNPANLVAFVSVGGLTLPSTLSLKTWTRDGTVVEKLSNDTQGFIIDPSYPSFSERIFGANSLIVPGRYTFDVGIRDVSTSGSVTVACP